MTRIPADRIRQIEARRDELSALMASGELSGERFVAVSKEYAEVEPVAAAAGEVRRLRAEGESLAHMTHDGDAELRAMAEEELRANAEALEAAERALALALLPRDAADARPAMLEIRAGTGGDEAALFAGDLMRMYQRYADAKGWSVEMISAADSDAGGYKEVVASITGTGVFARLKFESGVHRVQRVPATEAQGRIHTSTATVAVLPEAQEVDIELRPQDLRIEVCRSGGPGGQGVNTTDSAVQILHIPTGKIVRCQDGRSQQKNKAAALEILRTRLLEDKRNEEEAKYSAHRRSLIGRAGREEKIRTYNFPQNRITDHRIGLTLYNLDRVIEGDLDEMVGALQQRDMEDRLAEAGLS